MPYVTGGLAGMDLDLLRGLEDSGADAIEVGIPFSDPVMDGPVIQEASRRALEVGATPASVLETLAHTGTTSGAVRFKQMARRVIPRPTLIDGEHPIKVAVKPRRKFELSTGAASGAATASASGSESE